MTVLSSRPEDRLQRARESLEGLSVGDAFGIYCYHRNRELPPRPWYFTDDTMMALSIFEVLRQYHQIDQDALAKSFAAYYDEERGYGPAMHDLLRDIRRGSPWKQQARSLFGGSGSFGNGSAMRIPPLGAYFADDLDRVVIEASKSAEITHAHPEAIAGGIATAVGAAIAVHLKEEPLCSRAEFIDRVLPYIPDSKVKARCAYARNLPEGTTVFQAVEGLGNGSEVTCLDTVGFVLWCAGESLNNYEEALWLTGSGGGDRDTTCAMVGGIVAAYNGIKGIPAEWVRRREPLPNWALYDESYQQPA